MRTNVLRLERAGREIALRSETQAAEILSGEIFADGRRYEDIADAAGVCKSTVLNIAHGDTKSPKMRTCVLLFHALGWQITLRKH